MKTINTYIDYMDDLAHEAAYNHATNLEEGIDE